MNGVKMCDVCHKIAESMAVRVTEDRTGDVWEACTTKCYRIGRKDRDAL